MVNTATKDYSKNSDLQFFIENKLKAKFGLRRFIQIFKNVQFFSSTDNNNTLTIKADSREIAEIIKTQYFTTIKAIINENWEEYEILFKIIFQNENGKLENLELNSDCGKNDKDNNIIFFNEHKNQYSFENFIESDCNIEALRVCKSVCCALKEDIIDIGSSVLIYGDRGSGKTHLLKAMEKYYSLHDGKILYLNGMSFLRLYVNSVRNNSTFTLQDQILSHDIVMIDDIHSVVNKIGTSLFLSQIIKQLSDAGKFIVLTSSLHPRNLLASENQNFTDIITKAINLEISNNDEKIRHKIIINEIVTNNYNLPLKLADTLAKHRTISIVELKSAIKKLSIIQSIKKIEINHNLAMEILSEHFVIEKQSITDVSSNIIFEEVAKYYKIDYVLMQSKTKRESVCKARNVAIFLIHKIKHLTYQELGRLFGNRNHSTVISSIKKITDTLSTDKSLPSEIADIESKIRDQVANLN